MSATDKLTILFLAANPLDTDSLLLDEEVRAIDDALGKTAYRDRFDLRSHWALRYSDLPNLLLRYNPHIVHFSGHGSASGELIFNDDAGKSHPVPPDTLADLFSLLHDNIRCVVLNACYSDTQAEGIAKSIDCVVGMTRAVPDEAARRFAAAFYTGLGYGRSVATAFGLGRNSMGAYVAGEETTPKLLSPRVDAAAIMLVNTSEPVAPALTSAASALSGPLVVPSLRGLKGKQMSAAIDIILSAYDEAELKMLVRIYLNENLANIASGNNLRDLVFNLLEWAQMSGRLSELMQAVVDERPGRQDLREFVAGLH